MESILPPETLEGAGFESTRVRQFTVFLENRVGRLQALVGALEKGEHPIRAIAIEESGDAALVRLICADPEPARQTLQDGGFHFSESELIAVQLPKRSTQPLIAICSALLTAELNIHYAYPFLAGPRGAVLAIYLDDPTLASQILIRKGFTLIGESDLKK